MTRTSKQALVWKCPNPECFEGGKPFEFKSDNAQCPKCGAGEQHVSLRAIIHYLERDRNGPIAGQYGRRFRIVCSPKREHIATPDNGECATDQFQLVNCPGCITRAVNKSPAGTPITAASLGSTS